MKNFIKILKFMICVMSQQLKTLVTKMENLNLISRSHIKQKRN